MVSISKKALLSLLPFYMAAVASGDASGTGTTTRYWDCCKPSCAWGGKTALAAGATPVETCDINNNIISDDNVASGCNGGSAFMPAAQSPWAVDENLAYGFAAVNIAGGNEESWCCACYELTFTSGAVAGKKMIVQATNTGGDLGSNQFDIAIPGGGVGIFNGCTAQWGSPSSGWGAQYGGIAARSDCDAFPEALKAGCYWRFDYFENSDNPSVSYKQVTCPAALTAKTGCVRAGEVPTGPASVKPVSSAAPVIASSSVAPVAPEVAASSSEPVKSDAPFPISSSQIQAVTSAAAPVAVEPAPVQSVPAVVPAASEAVAVSPQSSAVDDKKTTTIKSTTTTYTTVYVKVTKSVSSHVADITPPVAKPVATSVSAPAPAPVVVASSASDISPASSALAPLVAEPSVESVVYKTITSCPPEVEPTPEPVVTVTVLQKC